MVKKSAFTKYDKDYFMNLGLECLRNYYRNNSGPNISTEDAGLSTAKSVKLFETFKNMFPDNINIKG